MADERLEIAIKAVNEASKALKDVQKDLDGLDDASRKASGGFGNLSNTAKAAALGGIGLLAAGLKFSIDAASEAEVVMAKTEAVIKSTGGAAGLTATEVGDMATEFSNLTGIDDELIQSAENVLLTFTSIGQDVFPQAMKAALNMSTALGTDLQGAVIMVGKALQDPVTGLTALRRAGVNVNKEMKDTVKAMVAVGDTAGAQAFILKELETEFGGVAEAAGNTFAGKMGKAEVAIGNLAEKIGGALLPVLGDAAVAVTGFINVIEDGISPVEDQQILIRQMSQIYGENSEFVIREREELARLIETEKAHKKTLEDMNEGVNEGTRALAAMVAPTEEVVFTEEELEKQAAATEKELARQAETLRKSREAAASAAEGFFGLAQAYAEGVTKMEQVKAAIAGLDAAQKSGAITADERAQAERELLLQFGLVTEASLSQARAQQELNVLLQGGKIDTDEYKEAMLKIPSAADDGTVTMGELGEAVGRASSQMNDAAQRAEQLRGRIDRLESKEITITTIYQEITQQIQETAGRIGGRQHGGPVTAGGMYRVHPPEMFFPQESGFIMSQADTRHMLTLLESIAGGIGGMGTNVNVGVSGDRLSQAIDVTLARRARAARLSGMRGLT